MGRPQQICSYLIVVAGSSSLFIEVKPKRAGLSEDKRKQSSAFSSVCLLHPALSPISPVSRLLPLSPSLTGVIGG